MRKTITRLSGLACGLAVLSSLGISNLTASAYTPGDVAAYAYEIGYPNASDYINQAYAAIDSGKIPPEDIPGYCAQAMAALQQYAAQRESVVEEVFDEAAENNTSSSNSEGSTSQDSIASDDSQADNGDSSSSSSSNSETGSNDNAGTGSNTSSGNTSANTGADDGDTTATPMTDDEFTRLPLDDKITYVNSLPEDQRTAFLNSLSNEARNSILKEMDTEKQLEMIESMMNTSDAFGLSFSVDSVSDDAIVISSRDEEGNLMSVTTLGNAVEETGIPYTLPILAGGGAIVVACLGIGGVLWYTARKHSK